MISLLTSIFLIYDLITYYQYLHLISDADKSHIEMNALVFYWGLLIIYFSLTIYSIKKWKT